MGEQGGTDIASLGISIDGSSSKVAAKWPLARIQAAIQGKFAYDLSHECLEELVAAVDASAKVYREALEELRTQDPQKLAELQAMDGKSTYAGQLLTAKEAEALGFMEDWVVQNCRGLDDLMSSAEGAQNGLKNTIAPGSDWAKTPFNDCQAVPHGHPDRALHDVGCAKGGIVTDPGIKSAARVEEKAKSRQRPHDPEPPYHCLVDASRLGLVYHKVGALFDGLNYLLQKAECLWVDNKFARPSALGYSDVNVGVRTLGHISEVQLSVDAMFNVKMSVGHEHYETIRSVLAQQGIAGRDMDGVQRLILKELDRTDGADIQEMFQLEAEVEQGLLPAMEEANLLGVMSDHEVATVKKSLEASKLRPMLREITLACSSGDPARMEEALKTGNRMADERQALGLNCTLLCERLTVCEAQLGECRAWVQDLDATIEGVRTRTVGTCPADRVGILKAQVQATCTGGNITEKHPSVLKALACAADLERLSRSLELGAKADEVICRPVSEAEKSQPMISISVRDRAQEVRDEVHLMINKYPQILPDDDLNVIAANNVVAQLEALEEVCEQVERKFINCNVESLVYAQKLSGVLSQSALIQKLPLPQTRSIVACFMYTSKMLLELDSAAQALEQAIEASNVVEEQRLINLQKPPSRRIPAEDEAQGLIVHADLRRLLWAFETQMEAQITGSDVVDPANPIVFRAQNAIASARGISNRGRMTIPPLISA
eukprot:gnl/MRDRNA2_/MRDRNA2_79232_c0_seq2.p1 gnl/MRDRNA2_/MRDRNA2_79232_c0~~gnl/MRDRNA2_/MRDRNA2_79232_c0_seq2.p1  ORF type:complete len:720 (-),score=169.26 gnl/MRDRNA2_/MRDRNA2_79232_c0_seq2:20-2179(-)